MAEEINFFVKFVISMQKIDNENHLKSQTSINNSYKGQRINARNTNI